MKKMFFIVGLLFLVWSCQDKLLKEDFVPENPLVSLALPEDAPTFNSSFLTNKPTVSGVELGQKLFRDDRLSGNNRVSCASCHQASAGYGDHQNVAVGIYGRKGFRNVPPLQNLAFLNFYHLDGNMLSLEDQPLVPIITHEEMNSDMEEVISKLKKDTLYGKLFARTFGDPQITAERIFKSIAQYEYTLISFGSKFDQVKANKNVQFSENEAKGYALFQQKCAPCHAGILFTDQQFRNVGFPLNPNPEEVGRARVTGKLSDKYAFRVPSLRNIAYTAPYGSFGQFKTLEEVLDYYEDGVLVQDNLDPLLKSSGNRIPMTVAERRQIIAFLQTLSDLDFLNR